MEQAPCERGGQCTDPWLSGGSHGAFTVRGRHSACRHPRRARRHANRGGAVSKLPEGWSEKRLGEVLTFNYGKALPEKVRQPGNVPVYGSNGAVGTHEKYLIDGPAIIIGRKGSVGEVHLSKSPCWPIDTTYFVNKFGNNSPIFWFWYLKYLNLDELDRATAIPGLNREDAYKLNVLVPPPAEQRRIVARLDALLGHLRRAREELAHVPRLVERQRQAILEAAFTGQLIEHDEEEAAETLLVRVRTGRNPSVLKKEQDKLQALLSELPVLPDKWMWTTIGALFDVTIGGTPSRKEERYWNGSIPWISSGEVSFRRISSTREMITDDGLMNSNAKLLPPGTILLGMIGEGRTRGQAAILDINATSNQNAAAILCAPTLIPPEWLYYWLMASYENTRSSGSGGVQLALNSERVRQLPLPLAPLKQQKEIIRRIEAAFARIERAGAEAMRAAALVERLEQATLARAFRGAL